MGKKILDSFGKGTEISDGIKNTFKVLKPLDDLNRSVQNSTDNLERGRGGFGDLGMATIGAAVNIVAQTAGFFGGHIVGGAVGASVKVGRKV